MYLHRFLVSVLLLIMVLCQTKAYASDRYLLNAGDILDISVWNEENLQKEVIVLPDGIISFPLAGEIMAAGKSITDLQRELTEKLEEYLSTPVVTVSVAATEGNAIYVMGKVLRPGEFLMNKPLDVIQALSLAGGLTAYAEEEEIIVIRREAKKQKVYKVNYDWLKEGRLLETNILLNSGDTIVVP